MAVPQIAGLRGRIKAFFSKMEPRHWSAFAIVVTFILGIAFLALAYVFGGALLRVHGQGSVEAMIHNASQGPFAAIAVMAIFSLLALAGMPQFMLIAATVVVFGPWTGALYSWLATMASAMFGFVLGRLFGAHMMRRFGGSVVNRASRLIARHGIVSSAVVRNVPSAPFIVLNAAAGATRMSAAKFAIGTGIGIVPKIAFIGLAGHGVLDVLSERKPEDFFYLIALVALWAAIGFAVKHYWTKAEARQLAKEEAPPPDPGAPPNDP